MRNIAIIGSGNIGRRYLQSFLEARDIYNIFMVDCADEALLLAKELAEKTNAGHQFSFVKNVEELPDQLDLAAITTTSGVRRSVIEALIKTASVRYLILEKFLFDKVDDYDYVEKLFQENDIRAWVNCTRREQSGFIWLKEELQRSEYWEISISGGDWGLGCNAVHYLDVIAYLSGTDGWDISVNGLEPIVYDSKRKPYKEIAGTISGKMGRCRNFHISSYSNSSRKFIFLITTNRAFYCIDEKKQCVHYAVGDEAVKTREFPLLYTSQIMERIVRDILNTETCLLATYKESSVLHKMLQIPLTDFFEKKGFAKGICPIT